jgi:hypothetical protein
MAHDQGARDQTTIEIVWLIPFLFVPVLGTIILEAIAQATFGLDSTWWTRAGKVVLGLALAGGVAGAAWFHREVHRDSDG